MGIREVMRTYTPGIVKAATAQYATDIVGFNVDEWLDTPVNVALVNSAGDVALFEHRPEFPQTVYGHYFFFSRGKEAIAAAEEFLQEIFQSEYYVNTITGLTPIENKGAVWMNKHLGFVEQGCVETEAGPCILVSLTKQQWITRMSKHG